MKNHRFLENTFEDRWKVRCLNSGGDFYTTVWENGKIKYDVCPCCDEVIIK